MDNTIQVVINRAEPVPPPVTSVTLTMSLEDALRIRKVIGSLTHEDINKLIDKASSPGVTLLYTPSGRIEVPVAKDDQFAERLFRALDGTVLAAAGR